MKYNLNLTENSRLYANNYDENAVNQIISIALENKNTEIRVMPDYHAGKGCVIGTTFEIKDKVNPYHIGVDVGCGVSMYNLGKIAIDLNSIDKFIHENIPHGNSVNLHSKYNNEIKGLEELAERVNIDKDRLIKSVGSLGSGNHYIELGKSIEGDVYISIHSGSRMLGLKVANYWNGIAKTSYNNYRVNECKRIATTTEDKTQIQTKLKEFKENYPSYLEEYLSGENKEGYLKDMLTAVEYAKLNRLTILKTILNYLNIKFNSVNYFESIHNYIDESNILRKGAISAELGEKLVIPINMRDGVILGEGKGNKEWNNSAPHGAGRLFSRSQAKGDISLEDFKESMKYVYSTCVNEHTLDESPMAYKSLEDILECVSDTITVIDIIKPIYNFKSNK